MISPVKNPDIQQMGNKAVPPAKMIADQQHRKPVILKLTMDPGTAEMRPDHVLRILPEKPGKKRPVAGFDNGHQVFIL
jgi:hypothetical protein